MNPEKRLLSQQKLAEQQQEQQQTTQSTVHEFSSVEAMLRHDVLHTPVPPAIAHRLQASIGQTPVPPRAWWRRLLRP